MSVASEQAATQDGADVTSLSAEPAIEVNHADSIGHAYILMTDMFS